MSSKVTIPLPITFGRDQWEAVTGLPLQTANEMVATGLIRSLKVGRRRLFVHADVAKMFDRLAARGETIEPRRLYNQRKAGR